MVSSIERDVRDTVVLLLKQFLRQSKEQRQQMSRVIEEYVSQVLIYDQNQLSDSLRTILDRFHGFHHWGGNWNKPLYTLKELRGVMNRLRKEAPT